MQGLPELHQVLADVVAILLWWRDRRGALLLIVIQDHPCRLDVSHVIPLSLDSQVLGVAAEVIELVHVDSGSPIADNLIDPGLLHWTPLHHSGPGASQLPFLSKLSQGFLRGIDEFFDEGKVISFSIRFEASTNQLLAQVVHQLLDQHQRCFLVIPSLELRNLLLHLRWDLLPMPSAGFLSLLPSQLPQKAFEHVTVARVSQVVAQPRQHHADLIAIGDFQLRLFMAQGLDEGHGQIGGADAMKKTVVGGTWIDLSANSQLLDMTHALEVRGVDDPLDILR
mmetsp:Transcript_52458/g.114492  ORF Transcript_52458/g.114492 Transcript_52458/m.114492 type:complete len:281 (-) Transcript_52458:228-1070(-)